MDVIKIIGVGLIALIIIIIIKEGITVAVVVAIPPQIPYSSQPIYVAIFIPIGPGVDSEIATIL